MVNKEKRIKELTQVMREYNIGRSRPPQAPIFPPGRPDQRWCATAKLLRKWNRESKHELLSLRGIFHLARLLNDSVTCAAAEYERPGRIAQSVQRMAKRFLTLDDEALIAAFRGDEERKLILQIEDEVAREKAIVDYVNSSESMVKAHLDVAVREAAKRLGFMLSSEVAGQIRLEFDWDRLRPALQAVANGPVKDEYFAPNLAFVEAIGAIPIAPGKRRGPGEEAALSVLALDLCYAFHELTGRAPTFSADGDTPKGKFRQFVAQFDDIKPHPAGIAPPIGGEKRLRAAVKEWKKRRPSSKIQKARPSAIP